MHSKSPSDGFRKDVQGLRAIAVVAVLLYHAGLPAVSGGYVGVDIFFVISGFLITSHLLSQLDRHGRIHFGSFYAKRIRRILPASFAVLALSLVGAVLWYPPVLMDEVRRGAVATALYVPNFLFAKDGTNYLAEDTPSLFQHYWSLGIEEQFYLLWPLLLMLGFLIARRNRKILFAMVSVLVVASFVYAVHMTEASQPDAFFLLPSRMWELGMGGLVAFLLKGSHARMPAWLGDTLSWAGIAGIAAAVFLFDGYTPFPSYNAALPVLATAAVIAGGASHGRYGPYGLLSTRPFQFLGLISYSLYLVHWPLLMLPQAASGFRTALSLPAGLALAALAIPLAWLSYRFIEQPFRKSSWAVRIPKRRVFLTAAASSLGCLVLATGAQAASDARPQDGGVVAEQYSPSVPPPSGNTAVPSNMRPTLEGASDDLDPIHTNGCNLSSGSSVPPDCVFGDPDDPRIVLFGDSHAAQWFPAIWGYAEQAGYSVEIQTKNVCPAVDVTVLRTGVPFDECDEWRENALQKIEETDPALVIMSSREEAIFEQDGSPKEEAWVEGTRRTIERIPAPVLVLTDTPSPGFTPSTCLSANISDQDHCAADRSQVIDSEKKAMERDAVEDAGASWASMNEYICDDELCRPILDDILVYRDSDHLTSTFAAELVRPMGEIIETAIEGS
ncbi:acyltransferase family protein [Actinomycetaceae bacterium L2_0104]